ncbi:hypothetical protein [Nocardia higoensis]|uniref:hypothetical protein n=1 Tax=Nocardia higoensis TaxID=228599 RepID=UPI000306E8D1|nr:hypothetical protein [Nocardia higoensis]
MTRISRVRSAGAVVAITLAALGGSATAAGEPLRLEPLTTEQPADIGHTSTPSGSGNSGSIDTSGSYEGDAFLGSAALAFTIDHPLDAGALIAFMVSCYARGISGDLNACMSGGGHVPGGPI